MDIQEQLAALRRRISRIDDRYSQPPPPSPRAFVEEVLSGQVVSTPVGAHFESERLYPSGARHGSVEISDLLGLPPAWLEQISGGAIPHSCPTRWAFLDTETTGLAGGSGTYAFLIGVGSIEPAGFRVRQFFMREYAEEPSQLHAVAEYLRNFEVLITYNGKSYDQPLLETRFRMCRARPPLERLSHLDLLFGARRLWKLRLENCRLTHLESQVLGFEREGDVPGALIPYIFFEYVRTRRALRMAPVFQHNALDILSLACLTAIVPEAFSRPETVPVRHGSDLLGLARWLSRVGECGRAVVLLHRAIDIGLPDHLLFPALLDIGLLHKKSGDHEGAAAAFSELIHSRNPCRARAYEELSKHYEHRERNPAKALEMTCRALDDTDTADLRRREERLRGKLRTGARVRCASLL